MKKVEIFRWKVPKQGQRKGYVSPIHRSREEALQEYGPGAEPILPTRREREDPETEEERRSTMLVYPSAGFDGVKPPKV